MEKKQNGPPNPCVVLSIVRGSEQQREREESAESKSLGRVRSSEEHGPRPPRHGAKCPRPSVSRPSAMKHGRQGGCVGRGQAKKRQLLIERKISRRAPGVIPKCLLMSILVIKPWPRRRHFFALVLRHKALPAPASTASTTSTSTSSGTPAMVGVHPRQHRVRQRTSRAAPSPLARWSWEQLQSAPTSSGRTWSPRRTAALTMMPAAFTRHISRWRGIWGSSPS